MTYRIMQTNMRIFKLISVWNKFYTKIACIISEIGLTSINNSVQQKLIKINTIQLPTLDCISLVSFDKYRSSWKLVRLDIPIVG